jgi:hypothetical protein
MEKITNLKALLDVEELTYANIRGLSRKYKFINTLNGQDNRIVVNSADDFDMILKRYRSNMLNHIIVQR